jgi:hypothetical protein
MFCAVLADRDALLDFGRWVGLVMNLTRDARLMVLLNSSSVVASDYFSRTNVSVEWFCFILSTDCTKQPISRFAF